MFSLIADAGPREDVRYSVNLWANRGDWPATAGIMVVKNRYSSSA